MITTRRLHTPALLARAPCHTKTRAGYVRGPQRASSQPNIAATAVSAVASEASAAESSAKPAFQNTQRFVVPDEVKQPFEAVWHAREAYMETQPGYLGFTMAEVGDTYTVTSLWASIPEWEAFNLSKEARRNHLPSGIWQYVPKVGEGFPEDFVPFVDMNVNVTARYPKKGGKK